MLAEFVRAEEMVRAEAERVPQAAAWPTRCSRSRCKRWPLRPGDRPDADQFHLAHGLADHPLARQGVTRACLSIEAEVHRTYLDVLLARDGLGLLDQLGA